MKGLIIKEFIMLRKNLPVMLIIILAFALSGVLTGSISMMSIVPVFVSMIHLGSINADEMSRWQQYSLSLPYSRNNIVTSRYAVTVILSFASALFVAMFYGISALMGNIEFSAYELLNVILFAILTGLAYPMILVPLILKFDSQKGRIFSRLLIGVMVGFYVAIVDNSNISELITEPRKILPWIVLAIVMLYLLSWQLSIKIYEKRDL